MAVAKGFRRLRVIGLHENRVALRQVHDEEADLLLGAAEDDRRLAEVRLGVSRQVRQRHEHLLAHLPPGSHVVAHGRITAVEPALVAKPLEDPLGGMALLCRRPLVIIQDLLDEGLVIRELRAAHRHLALVPGRRRARHHLRNRAPVDPEAPRGRPVA
jgi:hypothetical protein